MFINVYVQQMIAKLNQKLEEIVKNADTGKQYLLNQHACIVTTLGVGPRIFCIGKTTLDLSYDL